MKQQFLEMQNEDNGSNKRITAKGQRVLIIRHDVNKPTEGKVKILGTGSI